MVPQVFDIYFEDEHPSGQKTYYRLEISQGSRILITNPIFVEKSGLQNMTK
jgi:hypothetical protein